VDLLRWLTWWIADDPNPSHSALDRMDGLDAQRQVPMRCHNPQPSRGQPSPGMESDRVVQPGRTGDADYLDPGI